MHTKFILPLLLMTAAAITSVPNETRAAVSVQVSAPTVSVSIDAYLPAPPGVYIQFDAGRPYYVEKERRIYLKEKPAKHDKNHHEDQGRKHGHDK